MFDYAPFPSRAAPSPAHHHRHHSASSKAHHQHQVAGSPPPPPEHRPHLAGSGSPGSSPGTPSSIIDFSQWVLQETNNQSIGTGYAITSAALTAGYSDAHFYANQSGVLGTPAVVLSVNGLPVSRGSPCIVPCVNGGLPASCRGVVDGCANVKVWSACDRSVCAIRPAARPHLHTSGV